MPTILAMVILIVKANVIQIMPKSKTTGDVKPKVCPKLKNVLGNILPINPPNTIPAKINKRQVQLFLCFIGIYPFLINCILKYDKIFEFYLGYLIIIPALCT